MRRRRAGLLMAALVTSATSALLLLRPGPSVIVAECTATAGRVQFAIDPDQGANATTIAAEAVRLGLPDHAVSVGLAAALQESHLRNLRYGDRDSLGLFQQRPSQGWGTPAQLLQPTYAANAFFKGLIKVAGWEDLQIYQAAQMVQRSAEPAAYAAWDNESRTMAQGLTGELPGGWVCRYPTVGHPGADTAHLLASQARGALGQDAFNPGLATNRAWVVASWLVARAPTYSIARVTVAGMAWTPHQRTWVRDASAATDRVTYALAS